MARDRLAADVAPGSVWLTADASSSARVISTGSGYVRFEADGDVEIIHVHRFRERYVEPYDARRVRSQFAMSMANLENFHVFWSESQRKMYARTAKIAVQDCYKSARGRPALPPDAEWLETYSTGKSIPGEPIDVIAPTRWHQRGLRCVEVFFDDLHAFLARRRRQASI